MDPVTEPARRNQYRTASRHQMDGRPLLLRGGPLDGRLWTATVGVGERVFCGDGAWATAEVYLVTAEDVVDADGVHRSVAIPAFA